MFYVYIIYSKSLNKRYIGLTGNLRSRMAQHNSGDSNFTNKGKSWILIYYESFLNKKDAALEEKFLKTGKGRERLKFLLSNTSSEFLNRIKIN